MPPARPGSLRRCRTAKKVFPSEEAHLQGRFLVFLKTGKSYRVRLSLDAAEIGKRLGSGLCPGEQPILIPMDRGACAPFGIFAAWKAGHFGIGTGTRKPPAVPAVINITAGTGEETVIFTPWSDAPHRDQLRQLANRTNALRGASSAVWKRRVRADNLQGSRFQKMLKKHPGRYFACIVMGL